MRKNLWITLGTLVAGCLFAAGVFAQSAASLEAAVIDFYDKLNNEDPTFIEFYHDEEVSFPRTGLVLGTTPNTPAEARENFDNGLDFEVTLHHLQTRVMGDTGIATYYTAGTTTYPDGVVLTGTYRATLVTVWEDGRWQVIHGHLSELKSAPGE